MLMHICGLGLHNTNSDAELLMLAVENAEDMDVHYFLSRVYNDGRLSRIVVDECHLAITWASFRASMYALKGLSMHRVPLVLLSATVPPSMEQPLRVHF